MYQQPVLALAEAKVAAAAIIAEASKEARRPIAVAVVDADGGLIYYERMDSLRKLSGQIAIRKAYTAAYGGEDSGAFGARFREHGRLVSEMDPEFVAAAGGVCLRQNGQVVGGIGVSGRPSDEDEVIARVGVAALGL